jgi:hypothetical protein
MDIIAVCTGTGRAAQVDAAKYSRVSENILSKAFLSLLSSVDLNGFHRVSSVDSASLNDGIVRPISTPLLSSS